jgi:hypothetical protein
MNTQPMDIDPIDGGPREIIKPSHPPSPSGNINYKKMEIAEEEEARQAIDMFRGDDVSARVAAANRLEAVASVLGEQRTREVGGILYLFSGGFRLVCLFYFLLCLENTSTLQNVVFDFRGCVVSFQKKSPLLVHRINVSYHILILLSSMLIIFNVKGTVTILDRRG